ncbi:MAG: hypothetical protein AB8G15_10755 [Saprospiraceae bacterium]
MSTARFFTQLSIISLIVAAILFGLHTLPKIGVHQLFSWTSLGLFVVLSIVMYFTGKYAALSDNKNDFTLLMMGFIIGKLILCGMIILGYNSVFEPSSNLFLIPFLVVYLFFTPYELYFLIKLGRLEKQQTHG